MGNTLSLASDDPALIVEFIGVPGVGKSTVSRRVAALLREAGIKCAQPTNELDHQRSSADRMRRKLGLGALGVLHRRKRVAPWLASLRGSGQRSVPEAARLTLNWCYQLEAARCAARIPAVHLFDQGLFQAWWSLKYGSTTSCGLTPAVARALFLPVEGRTLVVALRATVGTTRQRLEGRAGRASRVDRDLETAGSQAPIVRAEAVLDELIAAIARLDARGSISLLQIDNDGPDDVLVAALAIATRVATEYRSLAQSVHRSVQIRPHRANSPAAT